MTGYRVRLARGWDDLATAERWQERLVEAERATAAEAAHRPVRELDYRERHALRSLGTVLHELGEIRRDLGRDDCIDVFMEAIELAADLGDRAGASACALNLGHAYQDLPEIRDPDQAETWYRRSLTVRPEKDFMGRGLCLGSLGSVARERFFEARKSGRPAAEIEAHLREAERLYREDLEVLPADAVVERAVAHRQLGNTYSDLGDSDRALLHYREAIAYEEMEGDRYGAASVRFNVALHLRDAGRLSDAMTYAQSALQGFEACGERGAELARKTRLLIDDVRERQGIRSETRSKVAAVLGSLPGMDELPRE
ncbi:MAG: tetratricopeptide repeat protein [bacterium]|nr:tetratricopeptide repeat protein [bacterium]